MSKGEKLKAWGREVAQGDAERVSAKRHREALARHEKLRGSDARSDNDRRRLAVAARMSVPSVTVTMRRRADGELTTVVRESKEGMVAAIRLAVDLFNPDEWCVQTISTPLSILTDLEGRAMMKESQTRQPPEPALLGVARRMAYKP